MKKTGLEKGKVDIGKLGQNWEGPYLVTKVIHSRAYKLADVKSRQLPRAWNINNLKKYY